MTHVESSMPLSLCPAVENIGYLKHKIVTLMRQPDAPKPTAEEVNVCLTLDRNCVPLFTKG